MTFEKQVFGALRNSTGKDACNKLLLAGDMNRNGWNDVVVCGHNGKLSILHNGESYHRWEHEILDENVQSIGQCGVLCDVTGSGYPDIVLFGDEENGKVIWYENPGKNAAEWLRHEAFTLDNPGVFDAVYIENFRDDGKSGILFTASGEEGNDVYFAALPDWTLQKIAENLTDENEKAGLTAPSVGLSVGDLDGDGSLEFVCGNHWFHLDGDSFTKHTYCKNKVGVRILLADTDGTDTLSIVSCERDAVRSYGLSGATLSIYKQGLDIEDPWEETVLADDLCDCGLLSAGKLADSRISLIVGEIGLEGQTSALSSFDRPTHLGGFDFSSETSRYVAAGKAPCTYTYTRAKEGYKREIVAESGLVSGTVCDVLHKGTLSVVGIPRIGAERWAIQCFTPIDTTEAL